MIDLLTAARAQMGFSLGFHMILAAFGIGMPLLMLIAEGLWLRTGKPHYLSLAKKWAKATGLLFAIGAVSGTALSFELGLLWPKFMAFSGGIIGPAFALEGFAFFIEAIFLGLYLYGWDRLSPRVHWWTGVPVAVSGMMSGVLVVAVNAWMQAPAGFAVDASGAPVDVSPWAPFLSPAWLPMALHSTLSCYIAVGFAVAGVYAAGLLRGKDPVYHRSAVRIALAVGAACAVLQPLSGDLLGRLAAEYQPAKLAAMESLFETQSHAPLVIGGIPDVQEGQTDYAIEIPGGLSLLAKHDPAAVVQGLNNFPRDQWPNVLWVHVCFQVMVGCGVVLAAVGLWDWWSVWRRRGLTGRPLLWALVLAAPLGFVALEAGWMVTELGRQPWIIYGLMRTGEAVTPASEVTVSFLVFTGLYIFLGFVLVALLRRLRGGPAAGEGVPRVA